MLNLFSKKKKFKASCDLSKQPLDRESAYLVSTIQVISSKKFWDNIMTEPETMAYTQAHFKTGDKTALSIRSMIFKKYANVDKAWVVSDAQIDLFDVDLVESKELANKWWDSKGSEIPDHLANSMASVKDAEYDEIMRYAIQDAGNIQVKLG